jgi:hypothetical protein
VTTLHGPFLQQKQNNAPHGRILQPHPRPIDYKSVDMSYFGASWRWDGLLPAKLSPLDITGVMSPLEQTVRDSEVGKLPVRRRGLRERTFESSSFRVVLRSRLLASTSSLYVRTRCKVLDGSDKGKGAMTPTPRSRLPAAGRHASPIRTRPGPCVDASREGRGHTPRDGPQKSSRGSLSCHRSSGGTYANAHPPEATFNYPTVESSLQWPCFKQVPTNPRSVRESLQNREASFGRMCGNPNILPFGQRGISEMAI